MDASSHGAGVTMRTLMPANHAADASSQQRSDGRERSPVRASNGAMSRWNAFTSTRTSTSRTVRTSDGGVIHTSHEATASVPSANAGGNLQRALTDGGYNEEIFLHPDSPDKQRLRH